MTKSKFLFIAFLTLIISFIALMFVSINGFNLNKVWFSIAIFFIGLYSLIYSNLFKLDSCLYYGILLVLFAISTFLRFFKNIEYNIFYPIYIQCFAIAHLTVFVVYRQKIHFKLFAILFFEVILITSYKAKILSLWALISINIIYLGFIVVLGAYRLRKNLRRR